MTEPNLQIQIRITGQADLPALIRCDSYAQRHEHRRYELLKWLSAEACWLAVADQRTVGFAVLEHSFFENGLIPLVCVAEEHRRNGYGLQLLHAIEARCETEKLFTSTNASNIVAQRLFEKAGFMRSGTIENLDENDPEFVFFKRCDRELTPT